MVCYKKTTNRKTSKRWVDKIRTTEGMKLGLKTYCLKEMGKTRWTHTKNISKGNLRGVQQGSPIPPTKPATIARPTISPSSIPVVDSFMLSVCESLNRFLLFNSVGRSWGRSTTHRSATSEHYTGPRRSRPFLNTRTGEKRYLNQDVDGNTQQSEAAAGIYYTNISPKLERFFFFSDLASCRLFQQ